MNESFVYVCYEANNHEIARDYGAVNDIKVFTSKDGAVGYVRTALIGAEANNFVTDDQCKFVKNGVFNEDVFLEELESECFANIVQFSLHQKNWEYSYSIVVKKINIER